MRLSVPAVLFASMLAGGCSATECTGEDCGPAAVQPALAVPGLVARDMVPYFPFDGQRSWTYVPTAPEVTHATVAEMRSHDPESIDGVFVYPVDYAIDCVMNDPDCVDQVIRTLTWTSTDEGVFLVEWTEGEETVAFEPPLQVAARWMAPGDVVHTETADAAWSATLVGVEPCPDRFATDIGDCVHIALEDGDGDAETGAGLVGDYWAAVGFNITSVALVGDSGAWELSRLTCEPEEACDGTW